MKQMKKLGVLAFALLMCGMNVMAKGKSSVSVTGSLDFAKKGGTVAVVFDYSDLLVNRIPVDDFLAAKDKNFNNEWEWVMIPDTEDFFVTCCSKYLDKGKFMASKGESDTPADYKMVLHLTSLDLGHAVGHPAIISGCLEGIDNHSGETLCVVTFENLFENIRILGGPKLPFLLLGGGFHSSFTDKNRWCNVYEIFVIYLTKLMK